MFKKIINRGFKGAVSFFSILYLISILCSINAAKGIYMPIVIPGVLKATSTELGAVALQAFLSIFVGFVMGALTVVWEVENWSILKQTLVNFSIMAPSCLFVEWITYVMDHNVKSFLIWVAIFVVVYACVWGISMLIYKKRVEKINRNLATKQ